MSEPLATIPGGGRPAAEVILAETGGTWPGIHATMTDLGPAVCEPPAAL
ncbi:hypothetical protein [Embleya hyalina]|nr:hypothetical protein [Embleya hyalina]